MTDQGKPVIIPTSSGALKSDEWRNDDYQAWAKRWQAYCEGQKALVHQLLEENARLRGLLVDAGVTLHPDRQTEGGA